MSLYKYWNPISKGLIGLQWLLFKTGLGSSNQFEVGAFLKSDRNSSYPDIQIHFLPLAVRYDGSMAQGHGFQIHIEKDQNQVVFYYHEGIFTPIKKQRRK